MSERFSLMPTPKKVKHEKYVIWFRDFKNINSSYHLPDLLKKISLVGSSICIYQQNGQGLTEFDNFELAKSIAILAETTLGVSGVYITKEEKEVEVYF